MQIDVVYYVNFELISSDYEVQKEWEVHLRTLVQADRARQSWQYVNVWRGFRLDSLTMNNTICSDQEKSTGLGVMVGG